MTTNSKIISMLSYHWLSISKTSSTQECCLHESYHALNFPLVFVIRRQLLPSVLWRCWLGGIQGIWPVKNEWWGAGVVICLERGAELHMAQLMPLPLNVSCFSKIQVGFTCWYWLTRVVPGKGLLNGCVCVCLLFGDSVDNTAEKNSSVFSLIRMHWLPSARACGQ